MSLSKLRAMFLVPKFGSFTIRMSYTMQKYLPSNIELVDSGADVFLGHYGLWSRQVWWKAISPKAVFIETFDEDILKCFGNNDVVFTYIPEEYEKWKQKGVNIYLTVFPIDAEKFYKSAEATYKMWDILCVATHGDYHIRSLEVMQEMGLRQLTLALPDSDTRSKITPIYTKKTFPAFIDYCDPIYEDERLRQYYNASKYCLSINPERGAETGYAEAAMSGCIPVVPKGRHWKWLYDDVGKFIDTKCFKDELREILSAPYQPLSCATIQSFVDRHNAAAVWSRIWRIIRENCI